MAGFDKAAVEQKANDVFLALVKRFNYCYVVCGGPEPGFDAVAEAAGKTPAVILPGYVSDNQLRWLYAHASGFVLPSLLEGFGLPSAEAISRGVVPLLGSGATLHEVAGDSAILVDPLNMDEIADGVRLLAHMGHVERQARLSELRQSVARFSRNFAVAAWRSTYNKRSRRDCPGHRIHNRARKEVQAARIPQWQAGRRRVIVILVAHASRSRSKIRRAVCRCFLKRGCRLQEYKAPASWMPGRSRRRSPGGTEKLSIFVIVLR